MPALIRKLLIAVLYAGRSLLGPANCRYAIGCTEFAAEQFLHKPLHKAIISIIKRLMSCNPIANLYNYLYSWFMHK